MSNFKSSNTLRNSTIAYPFQREKRFMAPREISQLDADTPFTDKPLKAYEGT